MSMERIEIDNPPSKVVRHGTAHQYGPPNNCRCDECTDANTARNNASRAKRIAKGLPEGIRHGASTHRNWNCTCTICMEASRALLLANQRAAGRGVNSRKEWTSGEITTALERADGRRYRRTARETALMLGRSVSAVNRIRSIATVEDVSSPAAPGE